MLYYGHSIKECGSQNPEEKHVCDIKNHIYVKIFFIEDAKDDVFSRVLIDETTVDGQNIPRSPKSFKVNSSCKHFNNFNLFF